MVSIYRPKRSSQGNRNVKKPVKDGVGKTITALVDGWDARGRGICRSHQPVLFADGGLPGELCEIHITKRKKQVWEGRVTRVITASEHRVQPFCRLVDVCGGCTLQHVSAAQALQWRQAELDTQFRREHRLASMPWEDAIDSELPRYRRKTRLAIDARETTDIKLGYRQSGSNKVLNVLSCPVLTSPLNTLLPALHQHVNQLKRPGIIGHISLLEADGAVALTCRVTQTLPQADADAWTAFGQIHDVLVRVDVGEHRLQTLGDKGESLRCQTSQNSYITVTTEDFVQVNHNVNLTMIQQAVAWLDIDPEDTVLDLFCGLGNFSLPIAKLAKHVTAVEGVATMVQRAHRTAQQQGIENVSWRCEDLTEGNKVQNLLKDGHTKVLLDPSREGAKLVCEQVAKSSVRSIVYVSCNPSTLSRDIKPLLVSGYRIEKVALMEMFPFTQHIEMMMLLTRT